MCIDHGRSEILVPEQFLNRSNVVASFEQMSSKAVSQRVTGGPL